MRNECYKEILENCVFSLEDNEIHYRPEETAPDWIKLLFDVTQDLTKYYLYHCVCALALGYDDTYFSMTKEELDKWRRSLNNAVFGSYINAALDENYNSENLLERAFMKYLGVCRERVEWHVQMRMRDIDECECI